MEKYEKLDAETIEFVREDVVATSCGEEVTDIGGNSGAGFGGGGSGGGR